LAIPVVLYFEKQRPKQTTVAHLKSNILAPQTFGLAMPLLSVMITKKYSNFPNTKELPNCNSITDCSL